jgi:hypothetical protein
MERARRHPRVASLAAFGVLALAAELVGRSLTQRIDVGRHVATPSYASAGYYPFLLAGVKLGIALLLARLLWRFLKARATERAARGMLGRMRPPAARPRLRLSLSPRLWATTFVLTSTLYLVHTSANRIPSGPWTVVSPLLHTSAFPVFAVLSVLVALLWGAVSGWLADYESYAEAALAQAHRLSRTEVSVSRPASPRQHPPRRLFGLAFDSRPPPLSA